MAHNKKFYLVIKLTYDDNDIIIPFNDKQSLVEYIDDLLLYRTSNLQYMYIYQRKGVSEL